MNYVSLNKAYEIFIREKDNIYFGERTKIYKVYCVVNIICLLCYPELFNKILMSSYISLGNYFYRLYNEISKNHRNSVILLFQLNMNDNTRPGEFFYYF